MINQSLLEEADITERFGRAQLGSDRSHHLAHRAVLLEMLMLRLIAEMKDAALKHAALFEEAHQRGQEPLKEIPIDRARCRRVRIPQRLTTLQNPNRLRRPPLAKQMAHLEESKTRLLCQVEPPRHFLEIELIAA